ncbi:class I SAM-dependent methyltransferase [Dysgonomonas macrotermitis]|uniref:Methyltransferase domain-containing protein n=1 Tax=Dysgonomonas macrotermitis TaxID=1346286 RepID=A0A1M4SNK0_9BACT|nr:class I SAM-dependent methyltransferase [Dysgonomonas macrotermitis]SHE33813.1 Methyltransferase domain-containing protein [Dysgonomonas macrotermitis]
MYKNIIDKKPALFERSDCNIWTDPYIQKQMLNAHLNQDSDGASRKQESILKTIDFISKYIKPDNRLLDLGCGPGLYTSLFKDKGYEVTGVDFNKASIDYAIEKRYDIKYICGNYIQEYPEGRYDAVIMIYCDMGTHSDKDRDKLLRNIYSSLDNGGVLIFDVFTEGIVEDKTEQKNWEYSPSGGFWAGNEYLLLSQTFHYVENKAFVYQYNLLTEGENKHFIVWDRYYSEGEITDILKGIGFRQVSAHKNILSGNNFTSNNEMFIIAEK